MNVPAILSSFGKDILHLIYPNICAACKKKEATKNSFLCMKCIYKLKPCSDFLYPENKFTRHLYGRVPVEQGAALFHFGKRGLVRNLIHELKYHGDKDAGIACGELIGHEINKSPNWKNIDYLVPVPIHPRKKLVRGYNQAECIAQGIQRETEIPILHALKRIKNSISQTKKGRNDRISALCEVFKPTSIAKKRIKGKHILIVDDVITTGATLEACSLAILSKYSVKLSMCTIGIGRY